MRKLGSFSSGSHARTFGGWLRSLGTECEVREDSAHDFSVWVMDEDKMEEARARYMEFSTNPEDAKYSRYRNASAPAEPKPLTALRRRRMVTDENSTLVTWALIIISVVLTGLASMPGTAWVAKYFYFSQFYGREFPEIADGQVWRLLTPIFLHGGILHLAFNMMWMYSLGGAMEALQGRRFLLLFVGIVGVLVNTSQYLVSGPNFVGMSGVVYAQLGYIWVVTRLDPGSRYVLSQQTMMFMMIWLVICIVGIIPNVANTQHVAGLVFGAVLGLVLSKYQAMKRRQRRFPGA